MTYEKIVAKVKEGFGSADVSNYEGHLAIQINITGEGEGIFYAEINEGKLYIEPYDYKNNDAALTADGADIIKILNGDLDPVKAFEDGKLKVEGDLSKALSIKPIIENNKKTAKKTTRKTTAKAAEKAEKPAKAAKAAKADAKAVEKAEKAAEKAAKTTAKAPRKPRASSKAAAAEEAAAPIIGLADPKKAPAAPKTTAKKTASAKTKESTKPAKKTTRTAKKG